MLFVSGLHASCTLSALKTAFTTAINSKGLTITPERVVLSQPMWTTKGSPSRYERKGWIILPTVESLQSVREAMTELRISIPGPVDSVTGAPSVLFEFTAPLTQHTIRLPPHMLPEHLSSSHRIAVDTYKARELAELFDTDRNIPIDSRLSAILSSPTVEQACTKSSDKLDIAIAYLRRVHFFVFYGGRFYQNEAHLLSLSAGCSYRSGALATQSSKGTIVSVAESTGAEATIEESKKEVTVTGEDEEGEEEDDEEYGRDKYEEDDEDADESRSRKRRLESEDNETTPVELTAVTTTDPSTMRVTDEPSDYVKRGHTDKRVEIMIRELRAKVAHSHALLEQRNKKEAAGVDTATNVDSEVEPTIENDGDAQASKALESGQRHEVVHLTRDEQDVQTLQALNDQVTNRLLLPFPFYICQVIITINFFLT